MSLTSAKAAPRRAHYSRALWLALGAALAACGGGHSPADTEIDTTANVNATLERTRAKLSLEAAGVNCAHGGTRIEGGIDSNGNGTLDAGEVTSVQFACHGAPGAGGGVGAGGANGTGGSSGANGLVRIDGEPAAANCAGGGARISAGLDANGNGVLDGNEVSSTRYVCAGVQGSNGSNATGNGTNGSNGANGTNGFQGLIVITTEPAGANCANGGKKATSGLDANRNSALDAGEVAHTSYLCDAAPGPGMGWISVSAPTQAMNANTGYMAMAATQVALTLPANPAVGDVLAVNGIGAGGWKIAQNVGQFITARNVPNDGVAGLAWLTAGPTPDWQAVASSADGSHLIAAPSPGQIHTSRDAGATWTARETSRPWSGVASSADGTKLVAVVNGGQIHVSADGGASWAARAGNQSWTGVASSVDGTKLVAVADGAQIHTSSDSGANWTARDSARSWTAAASSEDGSKLAATAYGGQIYTSTDFGANWAPQGPTANWMSVASSADGGKLVAATWGGQLHTSSDAGANWTARAGTRNWRSVASSADGSKLVAAPEADVIFSSTDSGATWTARATSRNWRAVASSADGSKLAAVSLASLVYPASQVHLSISGRGSVGTGGSISGGQYDMLKLLYVGNGEFVPIDYSSAGMFHVE